MALESASYITQLVGTNPTGSDQRLSADDHLRLIKNVLKNTFPALSSAVSATAVELNYCMSASANLQDQLNAKLNKSGGTISGALLLTGTLISGHISSTVAISATFANSASYAVSANFAASAGGAQSAVFATSATNATNAVNATSAVFANSATFAGRAVNANSAAYAFSATNATNAVNATNATNAVNATNATNASYAQNSNAIDGYDYTQLWRTDQAAASFSGSGYQKLPSGMIFQWGYTGVGVQTVTFPIQFPNACFIIVYGATDGSAGIPRSGAINTANFVFTPASSLATAAYYFAVGY